YSKLALGGVDPFVVVFGSSFFSALVMLPLALWTWPAGSISATSWIATIVLAVLCTGVAYVLFFRLIANAGPAYAASVTFIVPITGLIWGIMLLNETVTSSMMAGCVVVLIGAALSSGKIRWPRKSRISVG
ncbi:MAG: DMT family transporter, partial [Janthinobacterium lividum]